MIKSKCGIGVVSKNTVDACIKFSNDTGNTITLIPSRRQVDYNGGYVGWNTSEFSIYVLSKAHKVLLKRDHGGPKQGQVEDNGFGSLELDCKSFHAIHIDPWKVAENFVDGCKLTEQYLKFCYVKNPLVRYEIGTEESIFPYTPQDLEHLLSHLKTNLTEDQFEKIDFAVIQSGTSLKENENTGHYNKHRLLSMIEICKNFKVSSKEHNGDYLPISLIREKFDLGLDAINIAPEFGQMETQVYLDEIKNTPLFDILFNICYDSKRWKKWVDQSFCPFHHKEKLINICGHYVLSDPLFLNNIKSKVRSDIDEVIQSKLYNRLKELYGS